MLWLSGHWEWHALAAYVLLPLEGEPTLIYSMGGTHIEAVRRQVAVALNGRAPQPQRPLRRGDGRAPARARARARPHRPAWRSTAATRTTCRSTSTTTLQQSLPEAEFVFTKGFMHELLSVHSEEELDCIRHAGKLCQRRHGGDRRARPAGRHRVPAARRGRRRHPGGRRRHRLPDHRLDLDGRSGHGVRQSAPVRREAAEGRHHPDGARRRLSRLHARRSASRSASASRRPRCASSGTRSRCPAIRNDRRDRAGQAGRRTPHRGQILPPEGRAVAPDPLPRHRLRLRRPARLQPTTSTSSRSTR